MKFNNIYRKITRGTKNYIIKKMSSLIYYELVNSTFQAVILLKNQFFELKTTVVKKNGKHNFFFKIQRF